MFSLRVTSHTVKGHTKYKLCICLQTLGFDSMSKYKPNKGSFNTSYTKGSFSSSDMPVSGQRSSLSLIRSQNDSLSGFSQA